MKTVLKIIAVLLIVILFIIFPCILWLDKTLAQSSLFILISFVFLVRLGAEKYVSEFKLLIPFVSILFVVYLVFGLVGFRASSIHTGVFTILDYWIFFALSRIFLLLSTVFLIQILFSYFTVQDILKLPIGIHHLKVVILGRTLYLLALDSLQNLELHIASVPTNQSQTSKLKLFLHKKLALILALLFMVVKESQIGGELIDNRIRHCYREVNK